MPDIIALAQINPDATPSDYSLQRALLIAKSQGHADQYDSMVLRRILSVLANHPVQQAIVAAVLEDRRKLIKPIRISGKRS